MGRGRHGGKTQAEFPPIRCDVFFPGANSESGWSQMDALRCQQQLPPCAACAPRGADFGTGLLSLCGGCPGSAHAWRGGGENVAALARDVLHRQCLSGMALPGENVHANLGAPATKPARSGDRRSFVLVAHARFQSQPRRKTIALITVAIYLQGWWPA